MCVFVKNFPLLLPAVRKTRLGHVKTYYVLTLQDDGLKHVHLYRPNQLLMADISVLC